MGNKFFKKNKLAIFAEPDGIPQEEAPPPVRPAYHDPNVCSIVLAMHTFHRRDESELAFNKGDRMEIIDNQDRDWWLGTNIRTGETGYIPVPYVALASSLESQDWYFGKISRLEAEQLLLSKYNDTGAYMIRASESGHGHSISIRAFNWTLNRPEVKHYRVYGSVSEGFYISKTKSFSTLNDLIEDYMHDNGTELSMLLKTPCVRFEPELSDISWECVNNWEVPREVLQWKRKIGQGSYGEVWLCSWNQTVDVAVKTMKKGSMLAQEFLEEAKIMKGLRHKNILTLFAVCTLEEPILIITEYMTQGSLLDFLRDENSRLREINDLIYISCQVADAMAYLESLQLIHRDLAARNVLVKDGLHCKVSDFGLARIIDGEYNPTSNLKFPVKWTAPEAFLKDTFTIKSDVWSFGILLSEIFSWGGVPYPGLSKHDVMTSIQQGYRMSKPEFCPDEIYELMYKCWNISPSGRPTFSFIFNFLQNFDVQRVRGYAEAHQLY
ncbi:tyrosine-protein kinase SRK3-like [Penaeus indicus]|uniref:tyrosine-protein kinase SRK3-like n=1 Tax=Penaeus indicus TaxID=29960 RepID=UPI00300C7BA5